MKEVFKCDYCNYIGTAEEVAEHEKTCLCNLKTECCYNCKYIRRDTDITLAWDKKGFYVCNYNNTFEHNGKIYRARNPLPNKEICEHYERREDCEILPL